MRAAPLAVLFLALPIALAAQARKPAPARPSPDAAYKRLEAQYVREFLRRHPVVSTYLGGSGLYPELARADGMLRNWSPAAIAEEARVYRTIREGLERLDPAKLTPPRRIDREVASRQIDFMLHQYEERKHWQRSLDTYVNEAFRGIDWYMQGMTDQKRGRHGTASEWAAVGARVAAIPAYLDRARANLEAGVAVGNTPDFRMVERDGLASSEENAEYFENVLPEMAAERTQGQPFSKATVAELRTRGAAAARAFRDFRRFLETALVPLPKKDRFALGQKEYDWALGNNLRLPFTAAELFDRAWDVVEHTRDELIAAAQTVAEKRELKLSWDPDHRAASTRAVFDFLGRDAPASDEEMVRLYHEVSLRLVESARRNDMFDIPAEYEVEVTVTPPALEASIDGAAYYPAPPFKAKGVGRFYVTPTKGDPAKLKEHNKAAVADLAAHEAFPGHDWHFKVMTRNRDRIGPVRWLTPGEVEGSASMWEDSMASEGWALYAEHLMSEPQPTSPAGFYTPEERLYQLQGRLHRDLRVRIDTGIHTGRMSFDEAVDLFSEVVDFLPGPCSPLRPEASPEKKASCESAWRAIFRYSKWPTQAITYRLGKERILALRAQAQKIVPGPAGLKKFHLLLMRQGTIPPGYFEEQLLAEMREPLPAESPHR
jgi:uncharacterized protein (DUF885 family)